MPASVVWVLVEMLVATLVAVTVAPLTTAPFGSVTVPVSDEVPCANAVAQRATTSSAANAIEVSLLIELNLLFKLAKGRFLRPGSRVLDPRGLGRRPGSGGV